MLSELARFASRSLPLVPGFVVRPIPAFDSRSLRPPYHLTRMDIPLPPRHVFEEPGLCYWFARLPTKELEKTFPFLRRVGQAKTLAGTPGLAVVETHMKSFRGDDILLHPRVCGTGRTGANRKSKIGNQGTSRHVPTAISRYNTLSFPNQFKVPRNHASSRVDNTSRTPV